MATPEHTPEMTKLDYLTVVLYRLGLTVFAVALLLKAVASVAGIVLLGEWYIAVVAIGVALGSANIHLYDSFFRWLVPAVSWLGVIALALAWSSGAPVWVLLATGFFYAGMGMMAVKEQFCFKIPGLTFVPVILLVAWLLTAGGYGFFAGIALGVAGLLYLVMVVAKWRMPLHFDIGDKSYYKF